LECAVKAEAAAPSGAEAALPQPGAAARDPGTWIGRVRARRRPVGRAWRGRVS